MPLTDETLAGADVIVTLGRSVGPVRIPEGTRHEDWRIGDPVGAPLEEVRRGTRSTVESKALIVELTDRQGGPDSAGEAVEA
jgi:hypothetical protein